MASEELRLVVQVNARGLDMQSPDQFAEAIERCVVEFLKDPDFGFPNYSLPITDVLGNPVGTFRVVRSTR